MKTLATLPFVSDPQPFVLNNGVWHYYYLWNKDFPAENGTEWRHATSSDLEVWNDVGVAIQKYTTPYGDPWSGTVVIDKDNTANLGKDTFIAFCTMPGVGNTGQSVARWVSKDQGQTFTFDQIVLPHPQSEKSDSVFRDPRIIWMEEKNQWILALAETNKIGFYSSKDLQNFSYINGFSFSDLGVVECPNIFPLKAYDENNNFIDKKWIILCGANGYKKGFTTGAYYWVGSFDGNQFVPESVDGYWLDSGPDFYAVAISQPKQVSSLAENFCYAVAWKNNWDYARQATQAGYFGDKSRVRILTMRKVGNQFLLYNNLIWKGAPLSYQRFVGTLPKQRILRPNDPFSIPLDSQSNYLFISSFSSIGNNWPQKIDISFKKENKILFKIIMYPSQGDIIFSRPNSGFVPNPSDIWMAERKAKLRFSQTVRLCLVTTEISTEIVFNEGECAITSLILPSTHADVVLIQLTNGECILDGYGVIPDRKI